MPRKSKRNGVPQHSPATFRALTEHEVATITGKSVRTLQDDRHHRRGVPYRKVGRSVRYLEHEVIRWLDAQPRGGDLAVSA